MSAKLSRDLLDDRRPDRQAKLVLVTATTPTVSGESKTVTSIGLAQGLERIGKRAVVSSREPSLGLVFGMKGGAARWRPVTGGARGEDQSPLPWRLPCVTSAHNLLAALIDSHLFHGNELDLDLNVISWPRTLDMNDRALRRITVSVTVAEQ